MPRSNKTLEKLYEEGTFPELEDRNARFPQGEIINGVAHRAEIVIQDCILPRLFGKSQDGAHIAIASHGICLTELIFALSKLDPETDFTQSYMGYWNTGKSIICVPNGPSSATSSIFIPSCYLLVYLVPLVRLVFFDHELDWLLEYTILFWDSQITHTFKATMHVLMSDDIF